MLNGVASGPFDREAAQEKNTLANFDTAEAARLFDGTPRRDAVDDALAAMDAQIEDYEQWRKNEMEREARFHRDMEYVLGRWQPRAS